MRFTARFTLALKDPRHPLGVVFRRFDLRALETRDAVKLTEDLQRWIDHSVLQNKLRTPEGMMDFIRQGFFEQAREAVRELENEDPKVTRESWKKVQSKVRKGYMRMSPGDKRRFDQNVPRAIEAHDREMSEILSLAREVRMEKYFRVVSETGEDGRISLDLLTEMLPVEKPRKLLL